MYFYTHFRIFTQEETTIMAGGRPTTYKKEYSEQLIEHMGKGLSFESFAGVCRVCKDTLYEWEKVHSEFSDAKKIGLELNRLFWEKLGVDYIKDESTAGVGSTKLNATVYIFNMKNRFPKEWRDKQEIVTSPEDSKKVPTWFDHDFDK